MCGVTGPRVSAREMSSSGGASGGGKKKKKGQGQGQAQGQQNSMPDAMLCEDLCSRFILNCPAEELESFDRVMFLVEQAHWFYEDFVRDKRSHLKSLSLRDFATHLFATCASLQPYAGHLDAIYKAFHTYKTTVPVYGGVVLSRDWQSALMVKGWAKGSSWGFPRGKVNKDENPADCAGREVMEETGLSVRHLIDPEVFLEVTLAGQTSRMYILRGLDNEDTTKMTPLARKEISKIEWHRVADLPTQRDQKGANGKKYWNTHPFVKPLRKYVQSAKASGGAVGTAGMPAGMPAGAIAGGIFGSASMIGGGGVPAPPLAEPLGMPQGAMRLEALEGQAAEAEPESVDGGSAHSMLQGWRLDKAAVMRAVDTALQAARA